MSATLDNSCVMFIIIIALFICIIANGKHKVQICKRENVLLSVPEEDLFSANRNKSR